MGIYTSITKEALEFSDAVNFIQNDACGANSFFIGTVRNYNLGRKVIKINYDVYESMAIKIFNALAIDYINKASTDMYIYINHSQGVVNVGGTSLLIGVSTRHRKESINICNELVESIKHNAPIWKKEYYVDGETDWVKGHMLCAHNK